MHTDQLQPGERLRSAVGKTVRITSIEIRAGPEPVYNLEIAGEHVYSVTGSGLLVHNSGPCDLVPRGYYDSGYIGIVNGSADDFSDTLRATFGTSDVLPSSRLVSQFDTINAPGLFRDPGGRLRKADGTFALEGGTLGGGLQRPSLRAGTRAAIEGGLKRMRLVSLSTQKAR